MRSRAQLVRILFTTFAVALLCIATLLEAQYPTTIWPDIAMNAGVVIGSIVLIDVLWGVVGGDPLQMQITELKQMAELSRTGEAAGLQSVAAYSSTLNVVWLSAFTNARQSIDIAGHTLYDIVEQAAFTALLRARAASGVRIRILINHPTNPAIELAIDPRHPNLEAMHSQMRHTYDRFAELRDSLSSDLRGNLQVVALRWGVLHYSIRRCDDMMSVVPYMYSRRTPESPAYLVVGRDKPLFMAYEQEFDALFKQAQRTAE